MVPLTRLHPNYYSEEVGCCCVFVSLLFTAHLINCAQLILKLSVQLSMQKSTRYVYSVQKRYFERFFTVRSTTRTTDFPNIDHRQKMTQPPGGYYSEEAGCWCVFVSLLFTAHLINCAQLIN